ncbi:alpha/beta hydrolase [uncultured Helicobacter sp.]|uniref:RBBP9/YdeN family alpha/beta hydrolase n=1 Tax=uncultured Helicobacter sp. TaxID=175537 RepID=UPI0025D8AF69|nr:alpha/beta hydrolase [uncultured Helicobacter sp.]
MQVYITHGFEAYPQKHWFMWLKNELAKKGISTTIPAMPNADNPAPNEWLATLQQEAQNINTHSYFIGHSLGCIATLNFLNTLPDSTRIGGTILISGFDTPLSIYPQLNAFIDGKLNYDKLCALTTNRLVISARNDTIVPSHLSHTLAQNLKATFVQTHTGGHFMQDDGFTSFPLLLHYLNYFLDY